MAYTHTTFASAKTQLAELIDDHSKVFWSDAELGVYIIEAMRTFGALTGYWRDRATFPVVSGTALYDLPTQFPVPLAYTVTDTDLVSVIQYHLLEPAVIPWAGTPQFELASITSALQRQRNQFLFDTGVVLTRTIIPVPGPPVSRITLSDSVMDVRRAVWQPPTGAWSNLWRVDEWQLTAFQQNWSVDQGTPGAYSVLETPPLTVQLGPPPGGAGNFDMLSVDAGSTLDPAVGVVLGIPDDWAWVVKWGAMAEILCKDGPARDPQRSDYCGKRYQMGIELARNAASVLLVEVDGEPLFPDSLANLDAAHQGWQGESRKKPVDVALGGLNLMALRPTPSAGHSVTCDLVRKAPIPTVDGDFLELGREQLSTVLKCAEHLCHFKSGGAEFEASLDEFNDFLEACGRYNDHVAAYGKFALAEAEISTKEEEARERVGVGPALGALRKT